MESWQHVLCAGWTLHFWMWLSFYLWIFLAMVVSVIFLLISFATLSANVTRTRVASTSSLVSFLNDEFAVRMQSSVSKISGYPLLMLVCWGPSLVYDATEANETSRAVDVCNFFFPGLQGLLVALVFVFSNKDAKTYLQGVLLQPQHWSHEEKLTSTLFSDIGGQLKCLSAVTAKEDFKFDEECYGSVF